MEEERGELWTGLGYFSVKARGAKLKLRGLQCYTRNLRGKSLSDFTLHFCTILDLIFYM